MIENSDQYRSLMDALNIDVEVLEGPDGVRAVIDSPNGRVLLH